MRARLTRIEFAIIGALAALGIVWGLTLVGGAEGAKKAANPVVTVTPAGPTNSSPIAMSLDGKLVWSVNPGDDSVSVIRTDQNKVVKKIKVGDEPRERRPRPAQTATPTSPTPRGSQHDGDPDHQRHPEPVRAPSATPRFGPNGSITTGAEPWNIVASPDGRRVFVANSGQDTITVLDVGGPQAGRPRRTCATSLCNAPDKARHFQPRGMAVTKNSKRLFVTRFLSFTQPGGVQADDNGREGAVCRLDIKTASTQDRRLQAGAARSRSRRRSPASRSTRPATASPTRPRRSPTSSRAS